MDLLTPEEFEALDLIADAWKKLVGIMGDGTIEEDQYEIAFHIKAIQQFVMCRAAVRAYPDRFRL